MFVNYLKTAIRNLVKTKLYSLVNILGLAIGVAACLLILHYVSYEKSYDKFHEAGDRIYRLRYERSDSSGAAVRFASCTPPAAGFIRERYPEVEKIARIQNYQAVVSFGDRKFTEERMYFAEPDFLDILKFKFIKGDPLNGIREANNAFISQSTARKYFGDQDPMGKTFSVDKKVDYQVAGIFVDIPPNSHLKFDILLSYQNIYLRFGKDVLESWGHTTFFTYLRLKPGTDPQAFENKLVDLVESEAGDLERQYQVVIRLKMQPLYDIHLTSHYMQEYETNGDRDAVNFLFIIALFIILIAWVNYINLSTARSLTRAREVGLRKVVGASRRHLMQQFFSEIILINLAAVFIALVLVQSILPFFTKITGTPAEYTIWQAGWFWTALLIIFLVGVFLSGLYPVAVLTSFKPTVVLRGKLGNSARGINLRKILVIFQFVIALVMIAGTLTVYWQLDYMKNQDLGFDMDQVLVIKAPRIRDAAFKEKFATFKEELLRQSTIKGFCFVTEVPGRQIFWDNGGIVKYGEDVSKGKNYQIVGIDYDFVNLFDLKFAAGRNFSKEFPADKDALILNETGIKWMGFTDPDSAVGQKVDYWEHIYTIIGVLKDFHQQSLKAAFEPHIFRLLPYGRDIRGHFAVKITPHNVRETIRLVQHQYEQFFPQNPFEYIFLDEYYNQQYKEDELFEKVFGIFSFLAIFVTCLGIFGLSSFMAIQRTKEIGIRKVLGAGVSRILFLLTKDFLGLLLVSFVISLPLAILGIMEWLKGFSYRMNLHVWLFVLPLLMVSVVMLVTIGSHIVRAALANPVDSIRYE
jgi:putative ABC transport system permease protein